MGRLKALGFSVAKEQLIDVCQQLAAAEQEVDRIRNVRDRFIRDAIEQHVPYRTVATWTGLSRERLFKISTSGRAS